MRPMTNLGWLFEIGHIKGIESIFCPYFLSLVTTTV